VFVEVDVGMHRVGVTSPTKAAALAAAISDIPQLSYGGLLFYPGHIRSNVDGQDTQRAELGATLVQYIDTLTDRGFAPPVVSGGSTPAAWRMHDVTGLTEVRPGTYVYNDRTTALIGACDWEDCALTVLATVVSTSVKGQAVIDAGAKALAREPLRADGDGYGVLIDRPEVKVTRMSEEHGILDLSTTDWRPRLGDLVRVIPNHVCMVVQLFDEIIGIRGHSVETRWPVSARGRASLFATAAATPPSRPRAV
jgi:D-serine deaminase-like pyridoxal phosphate-dependent protein